MASAFDMPLTLTKAREEVSRWLERSVARVLSPGPDHIPRVMELLEGANSAGGNLVTDAQIAALAIRYRATVHTAHRDFMRFKGLKCHYPLDAV